MHKILVPTDFSKYSESAVKYAASLAKRISGEICLLHILEIPEMTSVFSGTGEWGLINDSDSASEVHLVARMMEEARKNMQELRKAPYLEGLNIIDNIEMGEVEILINSAVSSFSADLIIIGSYEERNSFDLFIGTQVEKIVRSSDIPVLTIKENYKENIENIVFASDFKDDAYIIFPKVLELANIYNAKIHLLKINTLENFETTHETHAQMSAFIEKFNIRDSKFTVYNDLMTETGIINYASDTGVDLIAIGTHGRTGISHLFSSSIAEELVNHAECPVLTINFKNHPE